MKKIFLILVLLCLFLPLKVQARTPDQITDWYIKDFQSNIVFNEDSSATITERIVADCGNLPNKHGIFRVLPTAYKGISGDIIKTPIKLLSITDFSGKSIPYATDRSSSLDTITWKIGEANVAVTGENNYLIKYQIKNIVNFQESIDTFFWNLSGNFWQIDIDRFNAQVILPNNISQDNATAKFFIGSLGSTATEGGQLTWLNKNTIQVSSSRVMRPGEGMTLRLDFPKGILIPPPPTFADKYGAMISWLIFLVLAFIPLLLWFKYGKDPKLGKTVVPEFQIPENLTPMELGSLYKNQSYSPSFVTAEIINFAVKGYIKIEEIPQAKILGLSLGKDYKFILLNTDFSQLKPYQKELLELLFKPSSFSNVVRLISRTIDPAKTTESKIDAQGRKVNLKEVIKLSEIKNSSIGEEIQAIHRTCADSLVKDGHFTKTGSILKIVFFIFFLALITFGIIGFAGESPYFGFNLIFASLVYLIIAFLMDKRTIKGAEALWKVKGFRLYMTVAEKYRQQFNEKENIFEKFLPYAIIFGLTNIWIKKMQDIYGSDYFTNYHPVWFAGSLASFDVDSFTSSMDSVASAVSSSAASGSGGGGSGGGGGGGGGGGW